LLEKNAAARHHVLRSLVSLHNENPIFVRLLKKQTMLMWTEFILLRIGYRGKLFVNMNFLIPKETKEFFDQLRDYQVSRTLLTIG
jgi:hypothetical protein